MPDRDDVVRAALERHALPAERSDFFDDLWELAQAREHAAAVRWRRVSAVLAVVATAAIAAASVMAAPRHDSLTSDFATTCALGIQGGLPVFDIGAEPLSPPSGANNFRIPGSIVVTTGGNVYEGAKLFAAYGGAKNYLLDSTSCRAGGTKGALGPVGLERAGTYKRGFQGADIRCMGPARVTLHVHLTADSKGLPTHVQLSVRNARTNKPLAYVDWTNTIVRAFAAPACRVSDL